MNDFHMISRASGSVAQQTINSAYKRPWNNTFSPLAPFTASISSHWSHPLYPSTRPHIHTTDVDMSLSPPLEQNESAVGATGPTTQSFATFNRGERAQSEPLASDDVEMIAPIPRTQSSVIVPLTESVIQACYGANDEEAKPRAVSIASTELFNPDSQEVTAKIIERGIKVRDFAFADRDAPAQASTSQCAAVTPVKLTPEIFDAPLGIAEVDYHWALPRRFFPISGKTLRRVLDIEWLTQEELNSRAHPLDIQALQEYDARRPYPYRVIFGGRVPGLLERRDILAAHQNQVSEQITMRRRVTRARAKMAADQVALAAAIAKEQEKANTAEAESLEGPSSPSLGKRKMDDTIDDGTEEDTELVREPRVGSAKKRRITPEERHPERVVVQGRVLQHPEKQYPCPLHAYDPAIYPDAARIIANSHLSSITPRPVVPPPSDTPPAKEVDHVLLMERRRNLMYQQAPTKPSSKRLGRTTTHELITFT